MLEKLKGRVADPMSIFYMSGIRLRQTEISVLGRRMVEVDGCRGLTCYQADKIAMRVSEGSLIVEGEGLALEIYNCGRLSISGLLTAVRFSENKA